MNTDNNEFLNHSIKKDINSKDIDNTIKIN